MRRVLGAAQRPSRFLALCALALATGCADASPTDPPRAESRVATIEVVSGANQRMYSGRSRC